MGNQEKRQKRAKLKAKQNRVAKQFSKESTDRVLCVSEKMLELFKTLPTPDSSFAYLQPLFAGVSQYVDPNSLTDEDLEVFVASLVVQFVHWSTSGSDAIAESELHRMTVFICSRPEFQAQFALLQRNQQAGG